jgi:hypothetical protein
LASFRTIQPPLRQTRHLHSLKPPEINFESERGAGATLTLSKVKRKTQPHVSLRRCSCRKAAMNETGGRLVLIAGRKKGDFVTRFAEPARRSVVGMIRGSRRA